MATTKPRRRRWPMPAGIAPAGDGEQWSGLPVDREITVVQPPKAMAHLEGRALYRALTTDKELWDSARFAAESGRSLGRFSNWVSHSYAVWAYQQRLAGVPGFENAPPSFKTDRTTPLPWRVYGQSPVWRAGDARKWMIQVHLMSRETGKFIPHKPAGRQTGAKDIDPRASRPSVVAAEGPALLAEYEQLRAAEPDLKAAAAYAQLAERHDMTVRMFRRRLEAARAAAKDAAKTAAQNQE